MGERNDQGKDAEAVLKQQMKTRENGKGRMSRKKRAGAGRSKHTDYYIREEKKKKPKGDIEELSREILNGGN